MNIKSIWFAFGVGVTAGAAVALLYAPQTGTDTRRKLREGLDDAADYLEEKGDYLKEQADRLTTEAASAINENKQHLGDIFADAIEQSAGVVRKTEPMF